MDRPVKLFGKSQMCPNQGLIAAPSKKSLKLIGICFLAALNPACAGTLLNDVVIEIRRIATWSTVASHTFRVALPASIRLTCAG
jgi:hypothetical protein